MNKIIKNSVVTLEYKVTDSDGITVDDGQEPLNYLHGHDDIFPGIEAALEGKGIGDTVCVRLQPDQTYGEYDAELVSIESINAFPGAVEIGMQLEDAENDDGIVYRVTDIAEDKVVIDGNHPLAGMVLVFECQVTNIRLARNEEILAGTCAS